MSSKDSKDKKIVGLLKEDGRMAFVEVGRRIGLSEAAVRRRVQNMIRNGMIRRFTIDVASGASAVSLISVSPSVSTPEVAEKLKRLKGVEVVYEITGEYDVTVVIGAANIAEINRCIDDIRKVEGVANTNTVIVLRTVR